MSVSTRAASCRALAAALPFIGLLTVAAPLRAQQEPGPPCPVAGSLAPASVSDPVVSLSRSLELAGAAPVTSRLLVRASSGLAARACAPWTGLPDGAGTVVAPAPARLVSGWSSGFADGRASGTLWNGRGAKALLSAGLLVRAGPFSAGVLPELSWEQNRDFPTLPVTDTGRSAYAHPWRARSIDMPQRFGGDAYGRIAPGQSFVRVDGRGWAAGFTTENVVWGPAQRNPLVLSDNAEGFPHLFAGTSRPVPLGPARIGLELIWGRLEESPYFDADPDNDHRLFTGAALTLGTPYVDGLEIGLTRVFVRYWPDAFGFRDAVPFIEPSFKSSVAPDSAGSRRDNANQLASLFMRWAFPSVGFEVYAEYAREDHAWDLDDLVAEPDHTSGATLGLQKVFGRGERISRVSAEVTRLLLAPTFLRRPAGPFYAHSIVRQGYTHRGQVLGASIGPASDAQYIAYDMITPRWSAGAWAERVRRDDLWMYRNMPEQFSYAAHDVELNGGITGRWSTGAFDLEASAGYASRRNRQFRYCNPDVEEVRNCQLPQYRDANAQLWLAATWRPGAGLR